MAELVFREDPYARACRARVVGVTPAGIVLDRTVFYPSGGGQPGDSGAIVRADGTRVRIGGAVKGEGADGVLHVAPPGEPPVAAGEEVEAVLDWERRYRHMRFHTALHLLCAVVPAPVTGGQVAEDKARLDFDIDMERLVKERIEAELNRLVAEAHPVKARWIADEELDARPELVRTMSVQPPRGQGGVRVLEIEGVDLQPCGGTHVANTREVGSLAVTKIRSEGARNRRVVLGFA
ncbi:MAG: alanyl-tRNA editing protein [Betaproteobacteria bacterium]|nr:alanyl-tRNA editing protein [Betaproteobacteria bacterium]